jgi:CRISPR associated protein Cas1
MQQQNFTPLYPPLQVRAGVLVVDGFGIALRVLNRGKLRVEDGIGRQRRSLTLDRAGSGLERLVLIDHAGYVTLEPLAWLRAIGAALVQIGRDGEVLAHSVPYGYDEHPIRRAQALAVTSGLDLAIARELIADKLDGQQRILVRLGADLREFDKLRAALATADSIERVRVIEANAAALYFPAWRDVRIRFRERDLARIPARWLRCDSRVSVLTDAPRAATSPINAMRNYLFACLESEARLVSRCQARSRSSTASSRARTISRKASCCGSGTHVAVRSPLRNRRANANASRRSVFTRSPGLRGINDGATIRHLILSRVKERWMACRRPPPRSRPPVAPANPAGEVLYAAHPDHCE